jgi:hypothetical protein
MRIGNTSRRMWTRTLIAPADAATLSASLTRYATAITACGATT